MGIKLKFLIAFYILLLAFSAVYAGEIKFTGSANINKGDVRSAQNISLKNALMGGIRKYVREVAPDRKADITEDYFMFVEDYRIVDRKLVNNAVVTTVHMTINDLIVEDVAIYATQQLNTAVFLVSGMPEYIKEDDVRKIVTSVFADKQFSTKEQIPFEQELIDRRNRPDIQTAFQSVSAAQYLFEFKFSVTSYKAGESCTLLSDSSYISANNLGKIVPILRTEVTVEDADSTQCILRATESSVDAALLHLREKMLPAPSKPMELQKFDVIFTGVTELRTINNIMDTLTKRKILSSAYMEGFFDDEATFAVECYISPEDLAEQIDKISFESIKTIEYTPRNVTLKVK